VVPDPDVEDAVIRLEIHRRSGTDTRIVTPRELSGIATGCCPGCEAEPFHVRGGGLRPHDDRTWIANGYCADCGDPVGYIYATADTLFGIEEDERVLRGRPRVY
jgi:hypothetical protein